MSNDTKGYLTNRNITAREVRLIDQTGTNKGVVKINVARYYTREAGMDLVQVSGGKIPTCRIMDYGKFRYEQGKKEKKGRSQMSVVKELKFRPETDTHDFDVRIKRAQAMLRKGNRVKCTVRYRGREMRRFENGVEMINRIIETLSDVSKVEQKNLNKEGRSCHVLLAPNGSEVE